jgi:hypothetical protein
MTGTELKAYVVELLDGRTDLDTQIARALQAVHREIQGNILIPSARGPRPRRLDWAAQYKGGVAASYLANTGIAVAALVDEGCTFKRGIRLAAVNGAGSITPIGGVDDAHLDGVRSGDVVIGGRQLWAYRNGYLVIEPDPGAGSYQVDLFQYLPWVDDVEDSDTDWFTENAWEALAKGAAARVAGDLGEQVRPVRWREDFIALALALHGEGQAQADGAAADGIRPPVMVLGWGRGQ